LVASIIYTCDTMRKIAILCFIALLSIPLFYAHPTQRIQSVTAYGVTLYSENARLLNICRTIAEKYYNLGFRYRNYSIYLLEYEGYGRGFFSKYACCPFPIPLHTDYVIGVKRGDDAYFIIAHEFFHFIQECYGKLYRIGMPCTDCGFYIEGLPTAMMSYITDRPQEHTDFQERMSLLTHSLWKVYDTAPFWRYILETRGVEYVIGLLELEWNGTGCNGFYPVLANYLNLDETFPEFVAWYINTEWFTDWYTLRHGWMSSYSFLAETNITTNNWTFIVLTISAPEPYVIVLDYGNEVVYWRGCNKTYLFMLAPRNLAIVTLRWRQSHVLYYNYTLIDGEGIYFFYSTFNP